MPRAGGSRERSDDAARAGRRQGYSDGRRRTPSPFTQIYTPAGFATAKRESGTVWIQAPQRLRFDYAAPDKKVFTYDDGEGRFFSPEDKQLTVRKLSPDERARLPIVFLEKPEELAAPLRDLRSRPARPSLLKPRAARLGARLVEARDRPRYGTVESLSYEDTSGNRTEFRFEGWKTREGAARRRTTGSPGPRGRGSSKTDVRRRGPLHPGAVPDPPDLADLAAVPPPD